MKVSMFECGTNQDRTKEILKMPKNTEQDERSKQKTKMANSEALSVILKNLSAKLTNVIDSRPQQIASGGHLRQNYDTDQQKPQAQEREAITFGRKRKINAEGSRNKNFYHLIERVKGQEAPVIQLSFGKRKKKKKKKEKKVDVVQRERGGTGGSWETQDGDESKKPDLKSLLHLVKMREKIKSKSKTEQSKIINSLFDKIDF